jgi:ribose transport system substrate-binding protein
MSEYLRVRRAGENTLVAAANDTSALGVLDAVRKAGQEANFAIVGQDCIPEILEEMRRGSSAIAGSISHEPETYGPRLIQLGISILRGYTVPPYNYAHHRVVTPDTLSAEDKARKPARESSARAIAVGEPV